jgi:hypothetical protein
MSDEPNDYSAEKPPQQYEIVQANEKVAHWFRCLVVVDEIKSWGIQGYTTIPQANGPSDAFIRLTWDEICATGGFNRFIVKEVDDNGKPES